MADILCKGKVVKSPEALSEVDANASATILVRDSFGRNLFVMSEQITIQVSDHAIQHAARIAASTRQSVETVVTGLVESYLAELPVDMLSDQEVLALTELKLTAEEQERFSDLLYENREGLITDEGREELNDLMKVYERGQLRKAQALEEAVKRGLIPPLKS